MPGERGRDLGRIAAGEQPLQTMIINEAPIGRRADDEAVRHRESGRRKSSERGAFAAELAETGRSAARSMVNFS